MQQRKHSILEAACNVIVGFCISYVVTHLVLAGLNIPISAGNNFVLVGVLTITSFIRAYVLRRIFTNALHRTRT